MANPHDGTFFCGLLFFFSISYFADAQQNQSELEVSAMECYNSLYIYRVPNTHTQKQVFKTGWNHLFMPSIGKFQNVIHSSWEYSVLLPSTGTTTYCCFHHFCSSRIKTTVIESDSLDTSKIICHGSMIFSILRFPGKYIPKLERVKKVW